MTVERELEIQVKELKADVSELIESIEASFRTADFKALSDYARELAEKSEVLDKQTKSILTNKAKQDFIKQEYINHIFQEIKETPISEIENYFQWGIVPEDKKTYCIELYEFLCKIFIPKTELTENEKEIFRNIIKNLIDKYLTQDKKDLFKNSNYYFIYESLTD